MGFTDFSGEIFNQGHPPLLVNGVRTEWNDPFAGFSAILRRKWDRPEEEVPEVNPVDSVGKK